MHTNQNLFVEFMNFKEIHKAQIKIDLNSYYKFKVIKMDSESFYEDLDNVYDELESINMGNTKLVIPNPILEGTTTNTYWKNIKKILVTINRPPDHFLDYMNREIHTGYWISSSKSDGIGMIGKISLKTITALLQNYIKKYVVCNICKSPNTVLDKNKDLRAYMITCEKCKSKYTI